MARFSGLLPLIAIVGGLAAVCSGQETLGILYWGDLRSAFFASDPSTDYYTDCADKTAGAGRCIGGLSNVHGQLGALKKSLNTDKYLDIHTGGFLGGETGYVGCMSSYVQVAKILSGTFFGSTSSYVQPKFTSVGISDLEGGLKEAENFLEQLATDGTLPVVSNCDPCNWDEKVIKKVETFTEMKDVNIGIVGFVNPLANDLTQADSSNGLFIDPAAAIKKVISDQGKNTHDFYIAIGSGNLDIAKHILDQNDAVKLVIYGGGVSNDFKNGLLEHKKGKWIAALGSKYGQTVGGLKLTIDGKTLKSIDAKEENAQDPIPEIETALMQDKNVEDCRTEGTSTTIVQLGGVDCWRSECNLGNLVTDAMVHCAYNNDQLRPKIPKNTPVLSVWHGGAMFRDKVPANTPIRPIDLHRWLPYHNKAYLVKLTGKEFLDLFEISAEGLQGKSGKDWGQFLQVSTGMVASYEHNKFQHVRVLHSGDEEVGVPQFDQVGDSGDYWVVIPSMMFNKKAAWKDWKAGLGTSYDAGYDDDCLAAYVTGLGHIATGFDERIFLDGSSVSPVETTCSSKVGLTIFLTLLVTAVIGGVVFVVYRFVIMPRRANGNWFW